MSEGLFVVQQKATGEYFGASEASSHDWVADLKDAHRMSRTEAEEECQGFADCLVVPVADSSADGVTARHSSASTEHYTPEAIVQAATRTLGGIDLDPASCELANSIVKATTYYDEKSNGFRKAWDLKGKPSRVFLNPPGGKSDNQERRVLPKCEKNGSCGLPMGHKHAGTESGQKKWWFKLAQEFELGHVEAAIFIGFSIEILQTTQVKPPSGLTIPLDYPLCFPNRRLQFLHEEHEAFSGAPYLKVGSGPPHANVIVCVTRDPWWGNSAMRSRFFDAFSEIGRCK